MSANPFDTARPLPATPSAGAITTAWIAYGCFAFGMLVWWPALVGLVICYLRRAEPDAGFVASHHGWLIRTFWWSALWYVLALGVIASAAWPIVAGVLEAASVEAAAQEVRTLLDLRWDSIFAAAGLALAGALGLLATWLWFAYRVLRGMIRLGSGIAAA